MNPAAAYVAANGLLKGAFDVFDAMLSLPFKFELGTPAEVDDTVLGDWITKYPVVMQGRAEGDAGAIALLFTEADAARIAAVSREEEATTKDSIDDDDLSTLTEVAEPALGGGLTNLLEQCGHDPIPVAQIEISKTITAGMLRGILGEAPSGYTFSYSAGENISGEAAVVFSQGLEKLIPEDLLNAEGPGMPDTQAALSSDEMSDILSGFDPAGGGDAAGFDAAQQGPDNLDMVLDIRLVATARLGRVELPLNEILQFGPGTIIEVGQLVDEPIELLINDKLVARGDVVVVDEKFGLRITEIVSKKERIESLG